MKEVNPNLVIIQIGNLLMRFLVNVLKSTNPGLHPQIDTTGTSRTWDVIMNIQYIPSSDYKMEISV